MQMPCSDVIRIK